jgi:hypothetical protein
MPVLDTSASTVALGQLSNLPFKNLIGGPLNAAIEAQASAAQSTIEFVQAVGFREVNGELDPIYVEFLFEDSLGASRRVRVPLLLILPIPFIVIDTVDIQFKARIAASAGQASESSEQTTSAARASAGFRFWGQRLDVSASFSSKKDSKASQDSKYSIEYTMDVHVLASQAGIPQGMAEVLNILQEGVSNVPSQTQLRIFSLPPVLIAEDGSAVFEGSGTDFKVLVLDSRGEPVAAAMVDVVPVAGVIVATGSKTDSTGIATITLKPASAMEPPVGDVAATLQIRVNDGQTDAIINRQVTVRRLATPPTSGS